MSTPGFGKGGNVNNNQNVAWSKITEDKSVKDDVVRLYYQHALDIPAAPDLADDAAQKLLHAIGGYKVTELIELLKFGYKPYAIRAGDIPQYSDFDVCYLKVVACLVECGYESVGFDKMGYFLREGPRKAGADKKYGENQAKTAALMGLCSVKKTSGISLTPVGRAFYKLPCDEKIAIKPQLCLYIPMMQNRFVLSDGQDTIAQAMSALALSTQRRRYPNVRGIETIISNAIDHELYGY